jgi:phospholipid/cholesterol/gamma-HCH transport system substrate-binding protein
MAYKFKSIEKIVGVFVVMAMISVFFMIIMIGRGKSFFVPKQYYYTYYNSGDGISKGQKIFYKGVAIGSVTELNLNSDNRIYVKFFILKEYANRVKADSVAKLILSVTGGGTIKITPGEVSSIVLPNNAYIISSDTEEGKKLLEKMKNEPAGNPLDLIANNVADLTALLKRKDGPLVEVLDSIHSLTASMIPIAQNLDKVTGNVDGNKDRINHIILSLQKSADNLVEVTANLKHNRLLGGKPEKETKTVTETK